MAKTFNLEIVFQKNSENNIVGYFDLDYTRLINKRKSTRAYIFMFTGGPISHFLKF